MNWYKLAQRKTLDEMIKELESNPEVDRGVMQWLKGLPRNQIGNVANVLIKNPTATKESLEKRIKGNQNVTEEQKKNEAVKRYSNIFKDHYLVKADREKAASMIEHAMKLSSGHEEMLYVVQQYLNGTRRPSEDDMTILNELKKWRSGKTTGLIEKSRKINEFKTPEALGEFFKKIYGEDASSIEKAPTKAINALRDLQKYYIGKVSSEKFGPLSVYRFGKDNMVTEEEAERVRSNIGKLCFGVDYTWCILPQENGEVLFKVYSSGIGFFLYVNSQGRAAASLGFGDRGMVDPENIVINEEDIMNGTASLLKGSILEGWNYVYGKDRSSEEKALKMYQMFGDRYGMAVFLEPSRRTPMHLIWVIKNELDEWENDIENMEDEWQREREEIAFNNVKYQWELKKKKEENLDKIERNINLQQSISKKIDLGESLSDNSADWVEYKLDSGNAPQGWIDVINKNIIYDKDIPEWGVEWVKKVLKSGNAPQEWIKAIHESIKKYGIPPRGAREWAKKVLDSGNAPQEWIKKLNEIINRDGDPPSFAHEWTEKVLESGNIPQEWIKSMYEYIKKYGYPQGFAIEWAKKVLDSGNAPQELIDAIIERLEYESKKDKYSNVGWAQEWIVNVLKNENNKSSNITRKNLINIINNYVAKGEDDFPEWAEDWVKEYIRRNKFPQELIDGASRKISNSGSYPYWAEEWVKEVLESGNVPQEWLKGIAKYIERNERSPYWAGDLINKALESGNAPQELLDVITNILFEPPGYYDERGEWAEKILESGNIPQDLLNRMASYIHTHGSVPYWAREWVSKVVRSANIPQELLYANNFSLSGNSGNLERKIAEMIHSGYSLFYWEKDWVAEVVRSANIRKK